MKDVYNQIVTVSYVIIQVTIAIVVSVYGAIYVRRCRIAAKENGQDQDIELPSVTIEIQKKIDPPKSKKKSFCEEWLTTLWQMRGVYSGLAVHSFDVLTDILVILAWIQTANIKGDNIDPQIMAYCGISIIIFSRILSAIAIYVKEHDFSRCILQLFDLLIFQEIYESHSKIKHGFKQKDDKTAIESTLSFKYVRNMEAIFESIPQSVLQLVYVLRTSAIEPIFIISIVQSILSMTISVLNNDATQMQEDTFKKYKQRFPPTFAFFKHALVRFSEITYRIGLLSLVWTVCEGQIFSIVLGIEFLFVFTKILFSRVFDGATYNADTILLSISFIIVIPAEEVYSGSGSATIFCLLCNVGLIPPCLVCFNVIACWSVLLLFLTNKLDFAPVGGVPVTRINESLGEFLLVIIWALYGDGGQRKDFLFSFDHGLSIFIASCLFYFIYSLFPVLFPDFRLPFNANIRSKWGYAYSNELSELKRIKVPKKFKLRIPSVRVFKSGLSGPGCRTIVQKEGEPQLYEYDVFCYKYAADYSTNAADFWDETILNNDAVIQSTGKQDPDYGPKNNNKYPNTSDRWLVIPNANPPFKELTAAMFAMVKGNSEIVEWLEKQGAKKHKLVELDKLKDYFEDYFEDYIFL